MNNPKPQTMSVLSAFMDHFTKTGREPSLGELSAKLDRSRSNIYYHLKLLANAGLLKHVQGTDRCFVLDTLPVVLVADLPGMATVSARLYATGRDIEVIRSAMANGTSVTFEAYAEESPSMVNAENSS